MRNIFFSATVSMLALASASLAFQGAARAQEASGSPAEAAGSGSNVFDLGQLNVVNGSSATGATNGWGTSGQAISESTVSSEEMFTYNRNRLDDALTLVPGVTVSTGSSRNEPTVMVRGFSLWQVPVYIDGVRVYLPYDNRLDLGRFVTPDLSEIQVQKGYVSVLNGPGGMGGAINLVTRKPEKPFEAEIRAGVDLGNTGAYSSFNGMAALGTKQEKYYLQATGSIIDTDGFFLPQGFQPINWAAENGGMRDFSNAQDWRVNLKAGFTPNETDEYSINYTAQKGEKGSPYNIRDRVTTPWGPVGTGSTQRNWTWPYWDYSSLYFLSKTQVAPATTVNTRFYYTEFKNLLSSYDNTAFDSQTSNSAFDSRYDDISFGGDLVIAHDITERDTLKAAFTYRRDEHGADNINYPDRLGALPDPHIEQIEDVMSAGLENTFRVTKDFDFVAGISYDYRDLVQAQDYNSTDGFFLRPLNNDDAVNWQFAGIYRLSETGQLNASVSSRTRFPTLFERYSSRFGRSIANPDLEAERATNYQVGWSDTFAKQLSFNISLFYSDVSNLIQSANTDQWNASLGQWITQNQNVGDSNNYGVEMKVEWIATDTLTLGGNYTYTQIDLASPSIKDIRPVGVPEHFAFLYAKWKALQSLTIIPSVEISSSRWTNMSTGSVAYIETDGFVLANLSAEYQFNPQTTFSAGVRNIFDEEYETQYDFTLAGRSFFVNGRVTF